MGTGVSAWLGTPTEANLKIAQSGLAWLDTQNAFTTGQVISVATGNVGNMLDFKYNGTSCWAFNPSLLVTTGNFGANGFGFFTINPANQEAASFWGGGGIVLASSLRLCWTDGNSTGNRDTFLFRDNVGSLGLRNGTSSQIYKVYNTYTSSSNNEAGVLDWQTTTNTLRLGTDKGSVSGLARDVQMIRGGTAKFTLSANTNTHSQPAKLASYTVSTLLPVSACGLFSICGVTDALAPVIGSAVTGGGSSNAVVVANNSSWIVMATL